MRPASSSSFAFWSGLKKRMQKAVMPTSPRCSSTSTSSGTPSGEWETGFSMKMCWPRRARASAVDT